MPKTPISLKLEPALLDAIDQACEYLEMNRTEFIEQAAERRLREIEQVVEDMSGQGKVESAIFDTLSTNPALMKLIAGAFAKHLTEEEIQGMIDRTPSLRGEAKRRRTKRKQQRKGD